MYSCQQFEVSKLKWRGWERYSFWTSYWSLWKQNHNLGCRRTHELGTITVAWRRRASSIGSPCLWTVTLMQWCSPMPVMSSSSSPLLYGWHPSTTIVVPATCYMRLVPCHHRACGSTWHWQILAVSEVHTAMACCRHGDMGACLGTQPGGRAQRRNVYAQIEPMHRDRKCKSLFHDLKLVNIEESVLFFLWYSLRFKL